ncbi:MAG TPA: hypothetical protein VNX86_09225 [Rhizomicrobium sp.]|nr:hypothetical protein [Rhizomicrobium sp.]
MLREIVVVKWLYKAAFHGRHAYFLTATKRTLPDAFCCRAAMHQGRLCFPTSRTATGEPFLKERAGNSRAWLTHALKQWH